eukprot:CAMPEP_0119005546 /NCGR_PEP_ID=MMETSP1176-20130426/1790_1 /TAXON_ID=265551 /ORGANISM="Synedropsis recta cf, Strain CCMP1620" /LENGTH=262 /DNA_ID=CAMNT_0006957373 /DNA_START=133 /DNA_END=921 /DNA_ORIENTATION=+
MPWEEEDYIPRTKSGKQKSPNMIRNQFQKYLDASSRTQTSILLEMHINNNSFRRFMNPKTYKNQWSATENGTYWAAAKFLDKEAHFDAQQTKENKINKKATTSNNIKKRKTDDGATCTSNGGTAPPAKKSQKTSKMEAEQFLYSIVAVEGAATVPVYDSCPEVVKKIKVLLQQDNDVTKASLCRVLGGINSNSLSQFLAGKKDTQSGNISYRAAYAFFEKKRLFDSDPKSKARLKNEMEQGPDGFSTTPFRGSYAKYYNAAF